MTRRDRGSWIFPTVLLASAAAGVAAQAGTEPIGVWVFVVVLGGWVITLCLHEFAHAAVALAGGDTSVRARGYLTLNPLRYTDPANSLLIPLVLLAIGGIPLPGGAVLIEPHRLRRRWWASLVSAAGPLTNLIAGTVLAMVAAPIESPLGAALSFLGLIQFFAGILNLLPVPGFDGWGILAPYLPRTVVARVRPIQPWAPLIVFAVLIGIPGASSLVFDRAYELFALMGGDIRLAAIGNSLFRFWS